ncbi:MAG: NAD(+) kinase [Chloroflexi bacterium]|nr:NAD(+) kinase [Chloroflexota bacterium]
MTIKRIGVLAHPMRAQSAPVAERIASTLQRLGLDVWHYSHWDDEDVRREIAGTDMVVAIGGDGAMLRAGRVCAPYGVPVLGVNMGHLGFLTEIQRPEDWEVTLEALQENRYWIEERMMIAVTAWQGDQVTGQAEALNDVVISRGAVTRLIHLEAYIDRDWTTSYNADALIIATATGSTAYALASGGPILPPELRNILMVPVAPHLSLDRPIILPEGAVIDVVVTPDSQSEIVLSADGIPMCDLCSGDHISVQASHHVSRFIRLRERNYFYRSLLDRLEPRTLEPSSRVKRQL